MLPYHIGKPLGRKKPMPSSESSVTTWLHELKDEKNPEAVRKLWERYFQRLVGFARGQIGNLPRGRR